MNEVIARKIYDHVTKPKRKRYQTFLETVLPKIIPLKVKKLLKLGSAGDYAPGRWRGVKFIIEILE